MNRKLTILAAILVLMTFSCRGRSSSHSQQEPSFNKSEISEATKETGSHWFYFSENGIHSVSSPSAIPATPFKPWTEAIRVSDVAMINSSPVLLINHLGIMTSGTPGSPPALHKDSLFTGNTAAGIYKTDTGAAIRLYRNSFFSESKNNNANLTCLALYDALAGTFTPLLRANDFGLNETNQCVALDRIGSRWYASFKDESSNKVDFTYLEFENFPLCDTNTSTFINSGTRKISSDRKSVV